MSTQKQKAEPKPSSPDSKHPPMAPALGQPQRLDEDAVHASATPHQADGPRIPDRTGGQNGAVDQKRNDEQQYHAAGVAHDPHNRTQERIDSGNPDAGDINDETREQSAPFNKTYGRHP